MSLPEDTKGPVIVWEDYGYEGWGPRSFNSLMDAVTAGAVTRGSIATVLIDVSKCIIEPATPPITSQPPACEPPL